MVVENDPVLRKVICELLRREGIQVLAQPSNGAEALSALKTMSPDVILTDRDMPDLDGIQLVQRVRAQGNQVPIVMLSGQTEPQAVALATAAGVNRYLAKPITGELLTMALRQAYLCHAA